MWSDLRLEKYRANDGFMCLSCWRDTLLQPVVHCWPVQGVLLPLKLQHPPWSWRWQLNDGLTWPEVTNHLSFRSLTFTGFLTDCCLNLSILLTADENMDWGGPAAGLCWTAAYGTSLLQGLSFSLKPPAVATYQLSSFDVRLHSGSHPPSSNSSNPPSFLLCFPTLSSHLP